MNLLTKSLNKPKINLAQYDSAINAISNLKMAIRKTETVLLQLRSTEAAEKVSSMSEEERRMQLMPSAEKNFFIKYKKEHPENPWGYYKEYIEMVKNEFESKKTSAGTLSSKSINLLSRKGRNKITVKRMTPSRDKSSQVKGLCISVFDYYTSSKSNFISRKVAKVRLTNGIEVTAYIPGEGYHLQENSPVLVKSGRVMGMPGVRYLIVRNTLDKISPSKRSKPHSKYGSKSQKSTRNSIQTIFKKNNTH